MDNRFVISAYHNYVLNGGLVAGFRLGKAQKDRFFFWAQPVEPESGKPRSFISANLFDSKGQPVLEMENGQIAQNPGRAKFKKTKRGFSIHPANGTPLFALETITLRNSYYTRFAGTLFDEQGRLIASGAGKTFMIRSDGYLELLEADRT
jgi:hypothetical protein